MYLYIFWISICIEEGSINLNDIEEIKLGHVSETFNELPSDRIVGNVGCHPDLCFTIKNNRDDNITDLDLVAETRSMRDNFVNLLNSLIRTLKCLEDQMLEGQLRYEM